MQLSVPTLPATPAASRPANSGRAGDRPSAADTDRSDADADFGSMLAAEPAARATAKPAAKAVPKAPDADAAATPESPADPAEAKPDQTDPAALEAWLVANGLIPAANPVAPTAPELDLLEVSSTGSEQPTTDVMATEATATGVNTSMPTTWPAASAEGEGTASLVTPLVTDARAGMTTFAIAGNPPAPAAVPSSAEAATVPAQASTATQAQPQLQSQASSPASGATPSQAPEVLAATSGVVVSPAAESKSAPSARNEATSAPANSPAAVTVARPDALGGAKDQTSDQHDHADRQSGDAENFAAVAERVSRRFSSSEKADLKKSLAAEGEEFKSTSGSLGINAAKPLSSMPASASISSPDLAVRATVAPAPMNFDTLVRETAQVASDVAQAAHRAVDSTMAIAEHFGTGGERSVNLQFSVSGVELAVRVELRGNAVHTTFRTDSPELRAALAAEWQSVNASQAGNRSQWLADPVFAGSSSGNSLSSDSGAAYQRNPDARSNPAFAEDFARLRAGGDLQGATEPAPAAAASSPFLRPSFIGAGRLHAFA